MFEMAVTLARYAERIGYNACAFFGVAHPNATNWACRAIWTQDQRAMVQMALAEAEDMLQQELGYPLSPHYFDDERHVWGQPTLLRWGHVVAAGTLVKTPVAAGSAVDHASDPATVTVNGATCDPSDVHVFHAGTTIEIEPESVGYTGSAGDDLVITIPWCRLVAPAYQDNPENGLVYADVATWIAHTVDVWCYTLDETDQARLITPPHQCCTSGGAPCTATSHTACAYVRLPEIGSIELHAAEYVAGAWQRLSACCIRPRWQVVSYEAGDSSLSAGAEDAIIRLAHSLMPEEPCGCDVTQRLWRRDRDVPEMLTRERLNCPFGTSAGAWYAWRWAQSNKLVRGSVL